MVPRIKVIMFVTGEILDFDGLIRKISVTPTKIRKKEDFPSISIKMGFAKDTLQFETEKKNAGLFQPCLMSYKKNSF